MDTGSWFQVCVALGVDNIALPVVSSRHASFKVLSFQDWHEVDVRTKFDTNYLAVWSLGLEHYAGCQGSLSLTMVS